LASQPKSLHTYDALHFRQAKAVTPDPGFNPGEGGQFDLHTTPKS